MPYRRSCLSALLLSLLVPAVASAGFLAPRGNLVDVAEIAAGEPLEVRVAMDAEGRFLVAWPEDGRLVARRFAADGTPLGGELEVFDRRGFGGVGADLGDLAMNGAGAWAAVWIGSGPVDQPVVMLRRFAADGTALDTQRVDVDPAPEETTAKSAVGPPAVAVGDGGLAVAWVESVVDGDFTFRRLLARRYDVSGTPLGEPRLLDAGVFFERPDVAFLPGGGAAVTAVTFSSDPLATSAPLYLLDSDGEPVAVEPAAGVPHPGERGPRLAAAGGATVLHAFGDDGGQGPDGADGSCEGVFATVHRADGSVLADEVRLNPFTVGCQFDPRAAALEPGLGWAVTWRDGGADPVFGSGDERFGTYLTTLSADGSVFEGPLLVLPGWVAHHELAAGGTRAVVAAVLPRRQGGPARVVARRLRLRGLSCDAVAGDDHLCLLDGRFRADVWFRNPYAAGAPTGFAVARPVTGDSGALWFFREDNLELLVKVLDGRPVNDHHWVFYGALSTVEYWVAVTDLFFGDQRVYHNPPFTQASRADVAAFFEDEPPDQPAAASAPVEAAGSPTPPLRATGRDGEPLDCGLDPTLLCLGQFGVRVSWHDPRSGNRGEGRSRGLTTDTGAFWFFEPDNLELMIKILDGGPVNGHHWVFYGSLTDVELTVEVTDFLHDRSVTYVNEPFELRSRADTMAFPVLPAP